MSPELTELIAKAKLVTMTPEQKEEQRLSFVYGNTKIENDRITRDSISKAAAELASLNDQKKSDT